MKPLFLLNSEGYVYIIPYTEKRIVYLTNIKIDLKALSKDLEQAKKEFERYYRWMHSNNIEPMYYQDFQKEIAKLILLFRIDLKTVENVIKNYNEWGISMPEFLCKRPELLRGE